MKEAYLPNIDLSSQIIVFDQQAHQGQLTITNKHNNLGVVFKIKATKLNIIDVRPAKGFIKPMSKMSVNFKLSSILSAQEMQATQRNDKFLIQFLNVPNQDANRQEIQAFWKAYKNNTANLQHGYGCYRVFMNLTGKKLAISNVKSQTMNSNLYKTAIKTSNVLPNENQRISQIKRNSVSDQDLSKKYTDLKQKQQELRQKRQNIFKPTPSTKSSSKSSIKTIIVLILLFLISFMAGNYVRSTMIKVKHHQKLKAQKKSFFNFF